MSQTASPSSQIWRDEFDKRIRAFASEIGVSEDDARAALSPLGVDGQSEQSLAILEDPISGLTTQDLFEAFVDTKMTQKTKLRFASRHLRGTSLVSETTDPTSALADAVKEMAASTRPMSAWKDRELLEALDEGATEVAKNLQTRTKSRPCIVFNDNQSVDIEESLLLVKTARKQPTQKEHRHSVTGRLVRVFRAGEFIAKPLDESPFFPRVALVNNYCSQSDTDWTGIPHEVRVLVRIYTQYCETKALSMREMRQVLADAKKGMEHFRDEYGRAVLKYDELAAQDKLPKLKVMPDDVRSSAGSGQADTGFQD